MAALCSLLKADKTELSFLARTRTRRHTHTHRAFLIKLKMDKERENGRIKTMLHSMSQSIVKSLARDSKD